VQQYTTQEILNGILENNSVIVQFIYDRYFHDIRKFIDKFGGSNDDAMDVFQDGIIVIYEQMKRGESEKIKNFRSYFFSICKFKWFNTIRDGKYTEVTQIEVENILPKFEFDQISDGVSEIFEKERRVKIYFKCFMQLPSICQKMIRYVAHGWAIEDIAAEMDFSVVYTYRKRQACLNKLTELVDKRLNENNNSSHERK
jgi:RNA polymerase sigma factor (sigma-70 family)